MIIQKCPDHIFYGKPDIFFKYKWRARCLAARCRFNAGGKREYEAIQKWNKNILKELRNKTIEKLEKSNG